MNRDNLVTDTHIHNSRGFDLQPFLIQHACYLVVLDTIYVHNKHVTSKSDELWVCASVTRLSRFIIIRVDRSEELVLDIEVEYLYV